MNKKEFDIAIIIINYNSSGYTSKCIESILNRTDNTLSYQLIIIDNASRNEDYQILKNLLDHYKNLPISLLRSKINTGFGGGNMYGVQQANAHYYLFLNNDTLLIDDPIKSCHGFMQQTPDAAVVGPKIVDEHGEKQLGFDHFSTFSREVLGKTFVELLFKKPHRRKDYDAPLAVDYVNGSFMFFRADDFNAVGGFDTNIFLFYEESDICYRLKQMGKKTYFLPQASYIHFQGKSMGKAQMKPQIKYELKTSLFYVIRKNRGYLHYQLLRLAFIIRYGLTCLVKPKYFALWIGILQGLPIQKSLKQKQIVEP